MSSEVNTLHIERPKKSEANTFVCPIKNFSIDLTGAQLVGTKAPYVFLKHKAMHNYMYDLNNKIIQIVKENCGVWFNTNMNPELIEDYYTNTLIYDKNHGDLIKLKLVKDLPAEVLNQTLSLQLTATNLRFFKQKFVLECDVTDFSVMQTCDIIDFSSDDEYFEEDPLIPDSELAAMKTEVLDNLSQIISRVQPILDSMKNAESQEEIIRAYNQFQEFSV